jgi:glycosyltransferase involved in cell wall biosynthesis
MVGSRGVPATYGGVERHVEEIGARLVELGHDVTVFCRTNYVDARRSWHRGMQLRVLPSIGTKHLDAISHTALASLRALTGFDVVHYHAIGPGLLAPLPAYLSRARVVQTIHGLDADRAKWGRAGRSALRAGEWLSARVPDAVICVSETLADHFLRRHGKPVTCIPNGVTPVGARLDGGNADGSYVLFVGRLVPEKAPDLLLRAFRRVPGDVRLVVAGGSSFTDEYVAELHRLASADPRVVMTGYVYGDELAELYAGAALFVSPSQLEAGPPLTLLEAASCSTPVLISDIPAQREAIPTPGPGQRVFTGGDETALVDQIRAALDDPAAERAGAGALRDRVLLRHSWDRAAERTAAVYETVLTPGR